MIHLRKNSTLAFTTSVLVLTPVSGFQENALRTVELAELKAKTSWDMEAARAWRRPAGVTFQLDGGATKEGTFVTVSGWLANATEQSQVVVLFPVGSLGLTLQPAPGRAQRLPPRPGEPPLMMPAPPPPELVTLPPRSRACFRCAFDLSRYAWLEGQKPELEWTFQFWDEPKPRGLLPVP